MATKIDIGGELNPRTVEGIVADASTIIDRTADKRQDEINADVEEALAGKEATITDLSTIRSGAAAGSTAVQPADLKDVTRYVATGPLDPTLDPSEYATTDQLAELGQKAGWFFEQPANFFTIEGTRRNNDGTLVDTASYRTTELIPLSYFYEPRRQGIILASGYIRSQSNPNWSVALFYDKSKTLVSNYAGTATYSTANAFPAEAIPENAVYIAFNQYSDTFSNVTFANYGYQQIFSEIYSGRYNDYKPYLGLGDIFTITGKYRNATGGYTANANYRCTDLLDLELIRNSKTDGINIASGTFRAQTGIVEAVFYDSSKTFLSAKTSSGSTYSTANAFPATDIPLTARYIAFNQYQGSAVSLVGYGYEGFVKDYNLLKNIITQGESGAFSATDWETKSTLVSKYNSALATYIVLCKCGDYCMTELATSQTYEEICETINLNFRDEVVSADWDSETNARRLNAWFKKPILRFCDAKIPGGTRDFSLDTGLQADEPSAIVSEDGSTLYVYAHLKRISTTDGVNWSAPDAVTLSGDVNYLMHININIIDGVYYLVGTNSHTNGNLYLFTSTDGLAFTQKYVIYSNGQTIGTETEIIWGNSYLVKDYGSGTFYLYIEYLASENNYWRIALATTDDIDDGFTLSTTNPIMSFANRTAGNPDFARGIDNRPIKHNGYFYMYYHSTTNSRATIHRARSKDLVNWEEEQVIFDNRDIPTGGDLTSGNADHTIIEFKGRSYLFYTWDINNASVQPYIKYTIDDRPMFVMLSLQP